MWLIFSVISPTDSFQYLVASHVTEPGSLLTEPGAVIKFSHFYSQPGTCMLKCVSMCAWTKGWAKVEMPVI